MKTMVATIVTDIVAETRREYATAKEENATMITDFKEETAGQIATLVESVEAIAKALNRGGGATPPPVDRGVGLRYKLGPSVFPKIRVLCDTGMGCLGFCPVNWTRNGVETPSVVFSVTATRILLYEWQPSLKDKDLDLFLQTEIVPREERLTLTTSEFDDVIMKTPYRKFIMTGNSKANNKNKSHYLVCSQEYWKSRMADVVAEFKDDKQHWETEIPKCVAEAKAKFIMMVQSASTIPEDKDDYVGSKSTNVNHLDRQLTAEERKTYPPWQFQWWKELFEGGMASYFGFDTTKPFHHVRHGVLSTDPKMAVQSYAKVMGDKGAREKKLARAARKEGARASKKRKKKGDGTSGTPSGTPEKKRRRKKKKSSSQPSSE